jgi:RHH-type proline utilization regulon transcriptional repressor/proline dehydrogenase/delta 1-pyrroline-5-carboxylate dehydrogenase
VDTLLGQSSFDNKSIPLPSNVFPDRQNSIGINVDIVSELTPFESDVHRFLDSSWHGASIINGELIHESMIKENSDKIAITSPYDRRLQAGQLLYATRSDVERAVSIAKQGQADWAAKGFEYRASLLNKLADKLEQTMPELVALCHKEAGKTVHDSIDEVREAVDFCRFYANQSQQLQTSTITTFDGKDQLLSREALGVVACISPWNFPLAIFLGQVSAALVAGNTVVAKPAEQTSLIAVRTVELMLECGFPASAIQLLVGTGAVVGEALSSNADIDGMIFTGSTQTAKRINQTLANRNREPVPFIAETGGQNAMIVDSTALPEQVVRDVVRSAFASAGQRCSALRVLFIQEDIAERVITLIKGAMQQLRVGLPHLHETDVGPVIDAKAKKKLLQHIEAMSVQHRVLEQVKLEDGCQNGDFVAPTAIEIPDISVLKEEQFGPILHVVRFKGHDIAKVVESINDTGFGLTMGIHSRNETTYRWIEKHARVGNCYINRDQVGAVVGVQPFGGQGLSGTGPKAGGPSYLFRLTKTVLS